MEIPQQLRSALDAELASVPSKKIALAVAGLSGRYRIGTSCIGRGYLQSREDIIAYMAYRLPATYAATHAALEQVRDRLPDWKPQSLLDVGAGPGTAMWAAATIWPELKRITLLEREEDMIAAGKRLAAYSPLAPVREANWLRADVAGAWETSPCDLVIMSYVLGELPQDRVAPLLHRLWEATGGTLVIIEPGTVAGFHRIKQAREQMLEEGAKSIAPCPHDGACPMTDNDWCHFAQRVQRSRMHRQAKAAELSYEDEKFSFLALSRTPGAAIEGRVIRHPQVRPGHIRLEVCTPGGVTTSVLTRKNREMYRIARDLRWGSVVPPGAMSERSPNGSEPGGCPTGG
jgi:ribosomal protein RSM22 (predicted rRNA methylase)